MANRRKHETGLALNVDEFLQKLKHSRKNEVEVVREAILSAAGNITERIKWNAPSFCIDGDDRITFRLQPNDRVQLVFHRGAKKQEDSTAFSFEDRSGLLEWVANDRAVVTFHDLDHINSKGKALKDLVRHWMDATRSGPCADAHSRRR